MPARSVVDTARARTLRWIAISSVILSVLALSASSPDVDRWEQTAGPAGGAISCVAVDIENPDIIYAAVEQAGIYRSVDAGHTWDMRYGGIGQWMADIVSTPHGVFASYSHFGLLHSADQGQTWQTVVVAPERRIMGVHYSVHGDVLLAKTEWGLLYASHDGGRTWRDATGDLPHAEIMTMAVSGPQEYWVASGRGEPNGLYHTIDGGRTWMLSPLHRIPNACVRQMLVADDDPNLILVGLHNIHNEGRPDKVSYSWISRDGGETWDFYWGGIRSGQRLVAAGAGSRRRAVRQQCEPPLRLL